MRLLSWDDLPTYGIRDSRTTVYRKMKAGKFPASVQYGPNRIAWVESEIQQYIADLIAARDAKNPIATDRAERARTAAKSRYDRQAEVA
jgi:prophage regulatory protein